MAEAPKPDPNGPRQNPAWTYLWAILATMLILSIVQNSAQTSHQNISYSNFKEHLKRDEVASVTMRGDSIKGRFRSAQTVSQQPDQVMNFQTRVPANGDPDLLPLLEENQVEISVESTEDSTLTQVLLALLPWVLLLLFFYWMSRRTMNAFGGRGSPFDMGKQMESHIKGDIPEVTFDDVAGQDGAKKEVSELIDFLRHPEQFQRLGAEVPRGILLMGPPGTGKTLMAKALAGEAGVHFFSTSASEFIEVFVGVGASRVRKLFEKAKTETPSIIFIDELDSIGRTRGAGFGGGHDEREQTLNQILAEMDGFSGHEAVIVVAATNRPDVLDPALLRPGRFDRHVTLDLPDLKGRRAILDVYAAKVPMDTDIDLSRLAAGTPGFSGADLKNLVNEAAVQAARGKEETIKMSHFDEARDKIMLGTARSLAITPEEKRRLAIHESGHTLATHFLEHADPLYKVSIIPRGMALGGTHQLPDQERHTYPEEYLRDRLAVTLAGRVAEKVMLNSVSSGADDDIQKATALARSMVSRWGMSDEIGPVDLRDSDTQPFLGREMAQPRHFSDHAAELVDDAVRKLLLEAEERATKLIEDHRSRMEVLVDRLIEKETLLKDEVAECLDGES